MFASDCTFKSHQRWSPPVVVGGPCMQGSEWPSASRVILCQWYSTILITNNCTILFGLSIHLHRFQIIECDVSVYTPIVEDCCAVLLVSSSFVLRMSLLFSILKQKAPIPRKEPGRTHASRDSSQRTRRGTLPRISKESGRRGSCEKDFVSKKNNECAFT